MAQTSTATTNFDKLVQTLIRLQLEELLRSPLPHLMSGAVVPANLVKGSNGTMRFLNVPDLSVVTGTPTPGSGLWLTEGVAPTSEALSIGYEEFTAHQAGRTIKITDVADLESPIALVNVAVERLARNVMAFADKRMSDILLAGTNAIFSDATATQVNNSTDDILAADIIQARDVRKAVAILKATDVPPFPDGLYRAIIHPFVTADLSAETAAGGWLDVARYASPESILRGEIGRFAGVRFIEASSASIQVDSGASSTDVYSTTIFGPGAWAYGDFGSVEAIVTPPGGHDDPLRQSTIAGWKSFQGGMIIGEGDSATNVSDPRYIRIESAATLGS